MDRRSGRTRGIAIGLAVGLTLGGFSILTGPAAAEICAIDDVPAATLLLPYFEVDFDDPNRTNTLFSINNASASPTLAHVTVWTDLSVPVLDFDVYLTGYDVITFNVGDLLTGWLPVTADDPSDPDDSVSNDGDDTGTVLGDPGDIDFPGTTGPCAGVAYAPLGDAFVNDHLIPALTGRSSSLVGCVGLDHGDNVGRGYVTVDVVTECSLDFPSTPGYFTGTAGYDNVLWGDYFYVSADNDFAQGETLVHIEACEPGDGYLGFVGNGAGNCPFGLGDFTFYSRYVGNDGSDQREGLASQFASRYIQGGVFDGGTDFIVWRDSRSNDIIGGACPAENNFGWYPLNQDLVVAFDEMENSQELCFIESDVSPPTGGQQTCFPIETGRYNVADSQVPGSQSLDPPFDFGWMYMDLDLTSATPSQAWVTTVMSARGRFSVGFDAIQLRSACQDLGAAAP
jgi:hypothetical protein